MFSPMQHEYVSETNEMAYHTPINFSKELKQVLFERNVLTAKTRKKIGSMLDTSGSQISTPNTEMEKRRNFRLQAIHEIVTSEKTYLKQLETLMQYFVEPLKEQSVIDDASHTALFGQLEMIYNLNSELLRELECDLGNVAHAFLKMAPFLKLYSVYAFDYRNSLLLVQQLTCKNLAFRKFLQLSETRPEVQRKLNSLMIAPIQRLPRYKLLLEQVLLYTSPADADFKSLKESIKQIESTVSHINSCIEDQEVTQLLINLQNSLLHHSPSIVKPSRKVIKEGVLHKVARNGEQIKRYCVLMSDIFMYCKILKERTPNAVVENSLECCCIFPLKKCKVYELFPGNFKLTCQGDGIIFCTSEVQLGRVWVTFIRDAIDMHIQCRKTLRKESSKRKPIRKGDVKNFELDYVLSPKRKWDYETTFRNRNRNTDSDDEDKRAASMFCLPRTHKITTSSSPYLALKIQNNKASEMFRKQAAVATSPENAEHYQNNKSLDTDSSTKCLSSRLYKYIATRSGRTADPTTTSSHRCGARVGNEPLNTPCCSKAKSDFRSRNVDKSTPAPMTYDGLLARNVSNDHFQDALFPLRSSGGSNKSGSHHVGWPLPAASFSGASKENSSMEKSLPPQNKRVKFGEVMPDRCATISRNGRKKARTDKTLMQQQTQEPFDFSNTWTQETKASKTTLREKIYEFFANLF